MTTNKERKKTVFNTAMGMRLAVMVVLFCAAGVLTYIVGVVFDTQPTPFDLAVQSAVFKLRGGLDGIFIPLTHMSDTATIVALCTVMVLLPSRKTYGLPLTCAAICGVTIYTTMKRIFMRARPDKALHLVIQGGYSFPSGHSTTSVVVFGLLAYLIFKNVENKGFRNVLGGLCVVLAVTVGISRIYVGVHWPTDVLTSWCIGGGVLLGAISVLEALDGRRSALRG